MGIAKSDSPGDAPPHLDSPETWDRLIEALDPARLLVIIESRMPGPLCRAMRPEDILQESLLHAWRDRHKFEWRGESAFRAWLLSVIDHRIRDAIDRGTALKRGGAQPPVHHSFSPSASSSSPDGRGPMLPAASTTPGRIAVFREQAEVMRAALESLPDELREVVRLRIFEECSCEDTAALLDLGVSAVKHRLRKGAALYQKQLTRELVSRSGSRLPIR